MEIEEHFINRSNWLRAAVLGANDGILSTASIAIGVAAASDVREPIILASLAGLVAGALSMAAGEYVSVSSQADTEKADLAREKLALKEDQVGELLELAEIYRQRGLTAELAQTVAEQLTAHNALEAHARDELGISHITETNPLQAAWSSALAFSAGSALPLFTVWLAPTQVMLWLAIASLTALALLGWAAAKSGGAKALPAVLRVLFWGSIAMAATAGIGQFFNIAVG